MTAANLKVLSFNICAITYPFKAHLARIALGVLLGQDWTHADADVPIDTHSRRARQRWASQADYIRSSGADLVLLQEVSSVATLDILLHCMGGEYESAYAKSPRSVVGVAAWAAVVLLLALCQTCLIQIALAGVSSPTAIDWAILYVREPT